MAFKRNALSDLLQQPKRSTYGYETRAPYPGEDAYFKSNPHVAGMAAEDDRITLNPYTGLGRDQQDAVAQNEAARLFMRQKNIVPNLQITDQQRQFFSGTPYENAPLQRDRSILARILTGDASVGQPTEEQILQTNWLRRYLESQR